MNKSLGIGFVGGGFITKFHIQSMIGVRDCQVLGVTSKTKSSAEDSASLAKTLGLGDAKVFNNVQEMVADRCIDAMDLRSKLYRIEVMEEIALTIESGRGSLVGIACEKPLGRNVKKRKKF